MLPEFLVVHRRALTALDALSQSERDSIAEKFSALRNLTAQEWTLEGVQQSSALVHFVRVADNLVVFFSVLTDGRFLIEDFVRQEMLDRFFTTPREPIAQV